MAATREDASHLEANSNGTLTTHQQERLAEKLLEIRKRLELSQGQLVRRLGDTKTRLYAPHISGLESQSATANKGGWRVKALYYVNKAIDETKKGIEAGE